MGKKTYYLFTTIIYLPRVPVLWLIRLYQKTVSPDHGPSKKLFPYGYCKYYPSCSEYGYRSVAKHGLFFGGGKALWRVVRCNPWSEGGIDKP